MTEHMNPLGRDKLTQEKRIALLEQDRENQSRVITGLVDQMAKGFNPEQLSQIRSAMREELADAGLRLDGANHQDEARRDFMFLRSLRQGVNGTAAKIGWMFIAAICGAIIWLVNSGLNVWRG